MRTFEGLNSFQLKIIAVIFMSIDHIAYFMSGVAPIPCYFGMIGRLAAPIFFFLMASSMMHTRSMSKYLGRLYVASVLMSVLNDFINTRFIGGNGIMMTGNIFQTMFLSCLLIYIYELVKNGIKERESRLYIKGLFIFLTLIISTVIFLYNANLLMSTQSQWSYIFHRVMLTFIPNVLTCEGSLMIVLMGLGFYFCLNNKIKLSLFFTLFSAIFLLSALYTDPTFENVFLIQYQWLQIGALPFLLLYNHEKGQGFKYFFYIYYPLHMIFLFGLQYLISA